MMITVVLIESYIVNIVNIVNIVIRENRLTCRLAALAREGVAFLIPRSLQCLCLLGGRPHQTHSQSGLFD